MNAQFVEPILKFIQSIGIDYQFVTLPETTFLHGIEIDKGTLLIDLDKLKYPGDLLHDAGHIAVMSASNRMMDSGDLRLNEKQRDGEEHAAIAWSYAAALAAGVAPEVVFHPEGYRGDSDWFLENYLSGNYLFLPLLEWMGMCYSPKRAKELGKPAYPEMIKWMRDDERKSI